MKRALAVLLIVAASLAGCGDDDDGDAAVTTTTTGAPTTTTTAEATSTTTTEPPTFEIDDADAVARRWIAAIAAGDDDTAISLTAPRSMEAIGGPEGFVENEIAMAEGWGSWDAAEDLELMAVDVGGGTAVVVLHGSVALEAPPEERWTAMPVVATEDGDRVEPFLDLGPVEVDPAGDTAIDRSPTFTAFVPGDRDVVFIVDGGGVVTPDVEGFDGDRQKATHEWDGELEPGVHGLTVVVTGDDGVMTRTFTYRVE